NWLRGAEFHFDDASEPLTRYVKALPQTLSSCYASVSAYVRKTAGTNWASVLEPAKTRTLRKAVTNLYRQILGTESFREAKNDPKVLAERLKLNVGHTKRFEDSFRAISSAVERGVSDLKTF